MSMFPISKSINRFFPKELVEQTLSKINQFFSSQVSFPKIAPIDTGIITYGHEQGTPQLSQEDLSRLEAAFSQDHRHVVNFLILHPTLCAEAVRRLQNRYIFFNLRSYYTETVAIAFFSGSLPLLTYALTDTSTPPGAKVHPKTIKLLIHYTDSCVMGTRLHFDSSSASALFPLSSDSEAANSTCLASSPSQVFVGQSGGLIRVISKSFNGSLSSELKIWQSVPNQSYSIVWSHGFLWMITENSAFKIDTASNSVVEIPDKPRKLVPPVVTDGCYFYAIEFDLHKAVVSIFTFNGAQFELDEQIALKGGLPDSIQPLKTPISTDGTRISFIVTRNRTKFNVEFSLITGRVLGESKVDPIYSWTTVPFTSQQIAIIGDQILLSAFGAQTPRWALGLRNFNNVQTISDLLLMQANYGSLLFKGDDNTLLLEYFINKNDTAGIVGVSWVLMNTMHRADRFIGLLRQLFFRTSQFEIKKLCVFAFLKCRPQLTSVATDNLLTNYLESGFPIDPLLYFSSLLDFVTIPLSSKAVDVLIAYSTHQWLIYPAQIGCILEKCCQNYIYQKIRNGNFSEVERPIQYILTSISRVSSFLMSQPKWLDSISGQSILSVWSFFLHIAVEFKPYFLPYSDSFIPRFDSFFVQQPERTDLNGQHIDIMEQSLFVFLSLILSLPFCGANPFKNMNELYAEFPSRLDRADPKIDELIYSALTKVSDIQSKQQFSNEFSKVRLELIQNPNKVPLLKKIESDCYTLSNFYAYLRTSNSSEISSNRSPKLVEWAISSFSKSVHKFTAQQEIIFSLFQKELSKITLILLKVNAFELQGFLSSFSFPLIFDPDVILYSQLPLNSSLFLNMDSEIVEEEKSTISRLFPLIDHHELFLASFLELGLSETMLNESEPSIFSRAFLALLYLRSHPKVHARRLIPVVSECLAAASPRVTDTLLSIIEELNSNGSKHLTKAFASVIKIVNKFFYNFSSSFLTISDCFRAEECVFIIIQHLKVMFNSNRSPFREFIEKFAKGSTSKTAAAICAVLNNSIEMLRSGVIVHFSVRGTKVEGKVEFYDSEEQKFEVGKNIYPVSSCEELWIECPIRINLSLIGDFEAFVSMFANVHFESDHLSVLKYASLYEFIQMSQFLKEADFIKKYAIESCNWSLEQGLFDYSYFLSVSTKSCSEFDFYEATLRQTHSPCSPISQNILDERSQSDGPTHGLLMTSLKGGDFYSSPVHPKTHIDIMFSLTSSKPITVNLLCFDGNQKKMLESPPLILSDPSFKFHLSPLKRLAVFSAQKDVKAQIPIPKSIKIIYIKISLSFPSVLEWRLEAKKAIYEANCECTTDDVLKPSLEGFPDQSRDSALFIYASLQDSSISLISSFRKLMTDKMKQQST